MVTLHASADCRHRHDAPSGTAGYAVEFVGISAGHTPGSYSVSCCGP